MRNNTSYQCFDRDFYEKAKKELLLYIGKRRDVVTCWEYGHISEPGVSDLDVIVILKNKPESDIAEYLRRSSLPVIVREAMAHANLIIVPEKDVEGLFYWDDLKVRELGESIERQDHSININPEFRRIAMLVDWSFERIYRIFAYRAFGVRNGRKALGDLKSFCKCVENLSKLSPDTGIGGYPALRKELYSLRKSWVEMSKDQRQRIAAEMVDKFGQFAKIFELVLFGFFESKSIYPRWTCFTDEVALRFPDDMLWLFTEEYSERNIEFKEIPIVQLPKCLLNHFFLYCQPNYALSKRLGMSFSRSLGDKAGTNEFFKNDYKAFLTKRMNYCNNWYDFLCQNKFNYGLYKFGWFLR
jgi:hypothetical protein